MHARRNALFAVPLLASVAFAAQAGECKAVHADLVESSFTQGCDPGEASCFLGVVDGNHGLRGTTHFKADSVGVAASTSPGSLPYSGPFEYRLAGGDRPPRAGEQQVERAHEHPAGQQRREAERRGACEGGRGHGRQRVPVIAVVITPFARVP